MHFSIFSRGEVCLFMKTERKYIVNSFEKFKNKVSDQNGTFDMALSCKCLQIPLWSLCGQHIPRTESRVGARKGTVKLFMNRILSFPAEVPYGPSGAVGRREGKAVSLRKHGHREPAQGAPRLGGGRARRAQPSPLPAHTEPFQRSARAAGPLRNLFRMCHAQSFKRKVNPPQWSSYKTGSPFPIPRIKKK